MRGIKTLAALLLLNGLLSFTSLWPTIAVQPDARIAPEFSILLIALSLAVAAGRPPSARTLKWLAGFYGLLVAGRYIDVVAPTLFGRPISLYWDVPQLPRFIWVTVTGSPWWLTLLGMSGIALLAFAFHRLLLRCMTILMDGLSSISKKRALWAAYIPLSLLIGSNYAGVQATWPYVSKPVIPTYLREVGVVVDALIPERAQRLLPASTAIDQALERGAEQSLKALNQRDVTLIFLESHGAVIYDQPVYANAVSQSLSHLEQRIRSSGQQVVSAFYTSPTIGGASDLAHLSLLSGIDLSDPRRHDILLTTRRPTLLTVFRQGGYDVFGLYHSVRWDWVERSYYGFDTYLSGPDLNYTGPEFGFWKIPDQFAMARLEQMHPRTAGAKPRITVMSTMSTHFPFVPVPPYQPDWKRLLGDKPFDEHDVQQSHAQQVNWLNMGPDYIRTLNYAHTWLAGWFGLPEPRETIYIMIGDHQPTSNIAGEGASWDVPVYVVSRDAALLNSLKQAGFSDGIRPAQRASLGSLSDLANVLLHMFSGQYPGHANAHPKAQ